VARSVRSFPALVSDQSQTTGDSIPTTVTCPDSSVLTVPTTIDRFRDMSRLLCVDRIDNHRSVSHINTHTTTQVHPTPILNNGAIVGIIVIAPTTFVSIRGGPTGGSGWALAHPKPGPPRTPPGHPASTGDWASAVPTSTPDRSGGW
jgi:hypothetical protein